MYPTELVMLTESFVCILKLKSWVPSTKIELAKKKELRRHLKKCRRSLIISTIDYQSCMTR